MEYISNDILSHPYCFLEYICCDQARFRIITFFDVDLPPTLLCISSVTQNISVPNHTSFKTNLNSKNILNGITVIVYQGWHA